MRSAAGPGRRYRRVAQNKPPARRLAVCLLQHPVNLIESVLSYCFAELVWPAALAAALPAALAAALPAVLPAVLPAAAPPPPPAPPPAVFPAAAPPAPPAP